MLSVGISVNDDGMEDIDDFWDEFVPDTDAGGYLLCHCDCFLFGQLAVDCSHFGSSFIAWTITQ